MRGAIKASAQSGKGRAFRTSTHCERKICAEAKRVPDGANGATTNASYGIVAGRAQALPGSHRFRAPAGPVPYDGCSGASAAMQHRVREKAYRMALISRSVNAPYFATPKGLRLIGAPVQGIAEALQILRVGQWLSEERVEQLIHV